MVSKEQKVSFFDTLAPNRKKWLQRNKYYYAEIARLLRFLIQNSQSVLEIGCGTGELLNEIAPVSGTGIDFSPKMLEVAQRQFPRLRFVHDDAECLSEKGPYNYVILSDVIGELEDVWLAFHSLHNVTGKESRIIITNYNYLWEPMLRLGEKLHLKMPQGYQNWLSMTDIERLLLLNGYESIKRGYCLFFPAYVPVLSLIINRIFPLMPVVKHLCMVQYIVARESPTSQPQSPPPQFSVSIVIPCRNERGNIENAITRIPSMGAKMELVFVDGESTDGTVEKIEEMIVKYRDSKTIRLIHQTSRKIQGKSTASPDRMLKLGKGDAVRKGFDAATGDILMILDADLTVPPEDLPKFYHAIASGRGEFINGCRLVYQMEKEAMRTLNLLANKFFGMVFTWLLGQPVKDTLCGTKVIFRNDYERMKGLRQRFGELDPFGDFDLLFGAAMLNMKIVEVPVRYCRRTYGEIKIERFKHGLKLLKMSIIGFKKLKLTY